MPVHPDLEISVAIAIDVARDDSGAEVELSSLAREGIPADIGEALVSAPGRVRIDCRKIDDVDFRPMEIGDHIAPAAYGRFAD